MSFNINYSLNVLNQYLFFTISVNYCSALTLLFYRDFYKNGDIYEGGWRQSKRDGHGECQYSSGDRYFGQWKDNNKHGKAEYKWKDGSRELGHWVDGNRHGSADYYDKDGKMSKRMYKDGEEVHN